MHELSVCRGLVQQLEQLAAEHQARGCKTVRLQIGPLSGIEPQLLQQAFPIASADSRARDATLVIEVMPVRVRCNSCGAETDAVPNNLSCGLCHDWHTQLLSGDEMFLHSVELSMDEERELSDV